MKNGNTASEPDWGKFGLDGEKQPLNPGGSSAASGGGEGGGQQAAGGGGTNLFGGQIQHDSELFADDQVTSSFRK